MAVLIPCFNEAATIGKVVEGFLRALPAATVYVYDNNSTDGTGELAEAAGAVVQVERRQGKGHVVRRMFADIDADCYLMVDGDDTYDASVAAAISDMVIRQGYDFVNVARASTAVEAYRRGHRLGNRVLTEMVRSFFGRDTSDMLSGYKALSRRFVKSFPAMSWGVRDRDRTHGPRARDAHADGGNLRPLQGAPGGLRQQAPHLPGRRADPDADLAPDQGRAPVRILRPAGARDRRPGRAARAAGGIHLLRDRPRPRLPTAVLSVGLVLIAWLSIFTGVSLDVVTKARQELKRLTYLSIERHPRR